MANLSEKCRTCLMQLDQSRYSVYHYKELENVEGGQSFIDMIFITTGVEINSNDLTTSICSNCAQDIINAFTFREKVIAVNSKTNFLPETSINGTHGDIISEIKCSNEFPDEHSSDNFYEPPDQDIDITDNGSKVNELNSVPKDNDPDSPKETPPIKLEYKKNKMNQSKFEYKRLFKCPICEKVIPNRPDFHRHILIHIICGKMDVELAKGKEIYNCDLCDFADNTQRKLMNHILKKHVENHHESNHKYVCEYCGKITSKHANHKTHLATHIGGDFNCDLCEKSFSIAAYLKYHKQQKHFDIHDNDPNNKEISGRKRRNEMFECYLCEDKFKQKNSLQRHLHVVHKKKLPTQTQRYNEFKYPSLQRVDCEICGSNMLRCTYYNHKVSVHGEKKHECLGCPYKTANKNNLTRHIKTIHQGVTPFQCNICGKKFGQKFTCDMHIKTHTGHPYAESKFKRPNRKRKQN